MRTMPEQAKTKVCRSCLQELAARCFYRSKDGSLFYVCYGCHNQRAKEYYVTHKQQKREYDRAYALLNKARIAKRKKQHALLNKDKIAAYKRDWAAKNRQRIASSRRQSQIENRKKNRIYQRQHYLNNKAKYQAYARSYYHRYKTSKLPKSVYSPDYFKPLSQLNMCSPTDGHKYSQKLRSGISTSPTQKWIGQWTEKAKDKNNRIIQKYSQSS